MQWLALIRIEDTGTENGSAHDAAYIRDFVESMEAGPAIKMVSYALVPVDPAQYIIGGPDAPAK